MPPKRVDARRHLRVNSNAIIDPNILFSVKKQKEWLRQTAGWRDLPNTSWEAQGVLGVGGQGICGHWKRKDSADVIRNQAVDVVVKQSPSIRSLEYESLMLRRIMVSTAPYGGTDHIIKLYKEGFRDHGHDKHNVLDSSPWTAQGLPNAAPNVARIYLEYCPKGDLFEECFAVSGRHPGVYWPEEDVWRLFGCLIKAALVMDLGTERPNDPLIPDPVGFTPIAHFDIKPANILIGEYDPPMLGAVNQGAFDYPPTSPHQRMRGFKIADFGLALPAAVTFNTNGPNFNTNPQWITQTETRGTRGWHACEQMLQHPERQIGLRGNVFGVGSVMYEIMANQGISDTLQPTGLMPGRPAAAGTFPAGSRRPFDHTFSTFRAPANSTPSLNYVPAIPASYEKLGRSLIGKPYSKHLIELVLSCLAWLPSERPTAQQVHTYVDAALIHFDKLNFLTDDTDPIELGAQLQHVRPPWIPPPYTPAETAALLRAVPAVFDTRIPKVDYRIKTNTAPQPFINIPAAFDASDDELITFRPTAPRMIRRKPVARAFNPGPIPVVRVAGVPAPPVGAPATRRNRFRGVYGP